MTDKIYDYILSVNIPPADVESYVEAFLENGFDNLSSLKEDLTSDDLESMHFKKGHIKRILKNLNSYLQEGNERPYHTGTLIIELYLVTII